MAAKCNVPLAERKVAFSGEIEKCAKKSESVRITCDVSSVAAHQALRKGLGGSVVGMY